MADAPSEKGGLLRALKKLRKNGLFRSLFLVVIIILGVLVFREALIFFLRTEYPLETPISGSMEPTLKIGDLLIVQGVLNGNEIYAHPDDGDIIVFRDPRTPSSLIVHRAIDKINVSGTWYFITKGDNNPTRDYFSGFPEGVPFDFVIGKVIWHIPYLGYVKIYLGTPLGMAVSILILVAFLLIENIMSGKTEKPKENAEAAKKTENS